MVYSRQPLQFERPVGAHADMAELEYVCCLHQTTSKNTIQPRDICTLLRSKYGVAVEESHVEAMLFDLGSNVHAVVEVKSDVGSTEDNNNKNSEEDEEYYRTPEEEYEDAMNANGNNTTKKPTTALDICQIMSILLAPHLLKQSSFGNMEEVQHVFETVFDKVLQDAGVEPGVVMDTALVQKIVVAYQEVDNISPEDIQAMLECLAPAGTETEFTLDAFRCALVSDLQLLNAEADESATSHWQDVWDTYDADDEEVEGISTNNVNARRRIPVRPQDHQQQEQYGTAHLHSKKPSTATAQQQRHISPTNSNSNPFDDPSSNPFDDNDEEGTALVRNTDIDDTKADENRPVYLRNSLLHEDDRIATLAYIDRVAESYASQFFAIVVMVMVVVIFVSYLLDFGIGFRAVDCNNYASSELLCQISIGILNWIIVMVQLIAFGVPFTIFVSMGMNLYLHKGDEKNDIKVPLVELGVGVLSVVIVMILSIYFPIHAALLNVTDDDEIESLNTWSHVTSITLGSMLLCFQLIHFLRIIIKLPSSNKATQWFLTPRITYKELNSKKAATYKSQRAIDHALALHEEEESSAVALSNYFEGNLYDTTETIGTTGWFWWHGVRQGWLTRREGVWFHTRILSSNLVQLFVIAGLVAAMTAGVAYVNEYYDEKELQTAVNGLGSSQKQQDEQQQWSLYIPAELNPRLVTYLEWEYVHPLDEAAFRPEELEIIQERYNVQPLHLPSPLGAWFMNQKALYFYDEPSSDLIVERELIPYTQPLSDLAVLNAIHKTTVFDSTNFSPGQQVLNMIQSDQCSRKVDDDDENAPFDVAYYQECATNCTGWVDLGLRQLSQDQWTIDNSVKLAASSQDLLVATAIESLVETIGRSEAIAGIIAGGVAGILAVFATSVLYLPSYIVCVLKFRSGAIPIDKYFRRTYRTNTEDASILFGSALWGCALSSGISAITIGSIVFLTGWEQSRTFMFAIFGHLIGWALTVGIKLLFLSLIRGLYVKALYRDRPGASNVVNLALECWHIGLAAGYMFIQAIFLLARTTIAIGHADTALPQAFRKDLVVSEAHRHPYIQRLAMLYLTKLRYGSKFCSRAGSCWRLIYVLALMPWLKKYRPGFENYDMITSSKREEGKSGVILENLGHENANLRSDNQRLRQERDRYALDIRKLNAFPKVSLSTVRTSPTSTDSGDSPEPETSPLPRTSDKAEIKDEPHETLVLQDPIMVVSEQQIDTQDSREYKSAKEIRSADSELALDSMSSGDERSDDGSSEINFDRQDEGDIAQGNSYTDRGWDQEKGRQVRTSSEAARYSSVTNSRRSSTRAGGSISDKNPNSVIASVDAADSARPALDSESS